MVSTVAALLVGALAIAVIAGPGDDAAGGGAGFAGSQRPPSVPLDNFVLSDEGGGAFAAARLRGRVSVVAFMYSTCEDSCPLQADQIRGALDDLGDEARDVNVAIVSVDPAADTPQRRKRFLLEHRLTGRASYLSGTAADLGRVWKRYGIRPQGDGAGHEHSAYTVLLDRGGRQRIGFPIDRLTPEALAHDLRLLLAESNSDS